jgi:sarcosine oxidase
VASQGLVSARPTAPRQREFAVVGAGLLGLAAARELMLRGRDVVVFEQAEVGHTGGGSHGSARIFRYGYPDPEYVAMARLARSRWHDLESAAGRQLLVPAGQLSFGEETGLLASALRQAGAPVEWLTEREARARFPAVATGGPCLFEPESCVIAAGRVLAALAAQVPDLRAGHPVSRIEPDGDRVTVQAGDVRVTARTAIVTAGPWTAGLLAGTGVTLPTTPTLEQVAYVVPADGGTTSGGTTGGGPPDGRPPAPEALPIFIRFGDQMPYGLPEPGTGRYKVGLHPRGPIGGPGRSGPVIPPGRQDDTPDPALARDLMAAVRRYLPGYRPEPVAAQRCVYDNTPDEDFVLDRAGPLVVGCGTSGHGFKFGPLLGEWLADLATGREPAGMPARFALARFRAAAR